MSNMRAFDSSTTLTVSEGYDLQNQQYYSKRRCRCSCDFFNKKCTLRVWQILLFLFIILVILALMGLLIAAYGPGSTDLKYSRSGTEKPGVVGDGKITTKEPTATPIEGTTGAGKETTPAKTAEPKTTAGPTTAGPTTGGPTTAGPTTAGPTTQGPTTAGPTTQGPTTQGPTTEGPTTQGPTTQGPTTQGPTTQGPTTQGPTTQGPTTQGPTTQGPTTVGPTTAPSEKNILECNVAIVGGGTGGLLTAYVLLDTKTETNQTGVCVFEREDRLGGKIFDFSFPQAPDVAVGLGIWNFYPAFDNENDIQDRLNLQRDDWITKTRRVEARGVYAASFDSLKPKAFPTLKDRAPMNNKTLEETAEFIYDDARNYTQFSTAETFLSYELSPEGAKLMEDTYGFLGDYMQAINPLSYREYLKEKIEGHSDENARPKKGMSELISNLKQSVLNKGGKIYLKETVTSLNKIGDVFILKTTNFTVKANKTVITPGPMALTKIEGDVMQNITDHEIFKSIVSVPAFKGAAVYESAWWNDSIAAQMNNTLQGLDMFISSSNCLGITMPYRAVGPKGRAVLHTIANNGGCSDKWGKILQISAEEVDNELKRALKYKFQRNDIPDPLETKYHYWQEGFWYMQKPGANFKSTTIRKWAKRPLAGHDVFLVEKAFYQFGGWLHDTIQSSLDALKEGWNLNYKLNPHT